MPWPLELVRPAGFNDDDLLDGTDLDEFDERILTVATAVRRQSLETWQACAVLGDLTSGALATGPGAYREGESYVGRVVCGWKLAGQGTPQRRMLAAFGRSGAASQPAYGVSGNGSHWAMGIPGPNTGIHVEFANGDGPNLVITATSSRDVHRLAAYDGSWQTATGVVASGHGVVGLHWIESAERLIAGDIGGNNVDDILVSDDGGATWSRRPFGGFPSVRTPRAFVDDGAGNVACLVEQPLVGPGSPSPKLMISHDDGDTWAPVLNTALPGDQNVLNDSLGAVVDSALAYVPDHNAFVVVSGSSVYRSTDGGVSWEKRTSTDLSAATSPFASAPSTPDVAVPNQFLAGIGPCLAAAVNWPITAAAGGAHATFRRPGVIYSFDLGDTWRLVDLGPTSPAAKRVSQIKAWNGRFVVGSYGVVYISGAVVGNDLAVDFSADG